MAKKIYSFDEVVGHANLITFLKDHLDNRTLPHFIIFEGDEGIGKSTLAKLLAYYLTGERQEVAKRIIDENKSTEDVLLYNMSINGGKDTAKDVEANLSVGLSSFDTKVVICDEAHGMSDAAQDVFLVSTEFLPDNVYLFMCTTDSQNLKPTLKSRAFTLHLHHLMHKEMVELLDKTVVEKNIKLQERKATLDIIATWADGKPRIALNLLEGLGNNQIITQDTIKELIDYMDVDEILPIVDCLSYSITQGLSYIDNVRINSSFVPVLVEVLKVCLGMPSHRLSYTDTKKIKAIVEHVDQDSLIKFVYLIAGMPKVTRSGLISAFLQCHPRTVDIIEGKPKDEVIREEVEAKRTAPIPEENMVEKAQAPSLDSLLARGVGFGD